VSGQGGLEPLPRSGRDRQENAIAHGPYDRRHGGKFRARRR
jgi:hypothetical protein